MEEKAKIKGLDSFMRQYPCKKEGLSIVNVISMEQPSQTGVKLDAFIKRINMIHQQYKVKKITFIVTDYLQRHYFLSSDLNSSERNILSNEKGKAWMKMNGEALISLLDSTIMFEILRWENLFSQNDFVNALKIVNDLYQQCNEFKLIVNKMAKLYAEKLQFRLTDSKKTLDSVIFFNAARNYSLEESAIWWPLVKLKFDFIVYPGRKNDVIEYTYNIFQAEGHFLPWLRYSFEKKTASPTEKAVQKFKPTTSLYNFSLFTSDTLRKDLHFKEEKYYKSRRHSQ